MSEEYFESALNSLRKPQDKARLTQILFAIRKEVDWPKKKDNIAKLREKGCLKHMVLCLQQDNVKIIDITLSILGNCCMDQSCARDLVRKYDALPHINSILSSHKHDSIYGRIFRIIGNVCHHWERLSNTVVEKQPSIVDTIVKVIISDAGDSSDPKLKLTPGTIMMGIRALRELLNITTAEKLVKKHNVIKAAAAVLIKYTPDWLTSKDNEEILNYVLQLLHCYSKYKYREILIGLQMTDNGNAVDHLGKLITLSPYVVVKIIMDLMKISTVRSDLPVADISKILIENIETKSEQNNKDEELKKREYLKCLCFLIQHPSNKEELKSAGVIPILIDFLAKSQTPSEITLKNCYLIVATLRNCMFDDMSVATMIQHGIVDVLRKKLEWLVGSSEGLNLNHDFKRRRYPSYENRKRKKSSPHRQGHSVFISSDREIAPVQFMEDCEMGGVRCASPSSGSDISFSSGPSFTPPSSPAMSIENETFCLEDSDSDEYSPICSEVEDIESAVMPAESFNDLNIIFQEDTDLPLDDHSDLESLADSTRYLEKIGTASFKIDLANEIIALIKIFARMRPVITELASSQFLIPLLKFVRPFNILYFTVESLSVILEILKHQEHLVQIMQTDFIPIVYDLTTKIHGDNCSVCVQLYNVGHILLRKFTHLAESGYGRGEIAHNLLRGSFPLKQKLVLVIPYIVRNRTLLGKFMMNCGGLNILIKILKDERDLHHKTIKVLCAMAITKGIKNPVEDTVTETVKLQITDDQYRLKENCAKVVTFEFDDGTCLKVDRDFLAQQSDYFDRLLSGTFKESQEDRVRLCNVASKSFKCLLLLMEYDFKWPQVPLLDMDLVTLLDVIVLTDRYLLLNLCNTLMSYVEKFRISTRTAPSIYRWSLESGTNLLRIETVAFALVANVVEHERYAMFQSMFDHGYSEQLIDDIHKLLQRYL